MTEGVVLAFDRPTLRTLLEGHPLVAMRAVDQLVRRLRDAEDQIEIRMLRGVQSKVTSALLKRAGRATGAAELTISPVELSTRVGLDVEAVKRTVARLRERQYIRITGERIEIPDVEVLRRLYTLLNTKDDLAGPDAQRDVLDDGNATVPGGDPLRTQERIRPRRGRRGGAIRQGRRQQFRVAAGALSWCPGR